MIQLDGEGNLTDFLMNDKCAAGTGRFLEVITRTLGARVEQLDELLQGADPHDISSMCTVFAESEAISLRSAGIPAESILAGIVRSMARRSANFIGRLGARPTVLLPAASATAPPSATIWRKDWAATWPPTRTPSLPVRWGGPVRCACPHGRQVMNEEFLYLFPPLGTVRLRKRLGSSPRLSGLRRTAPAQCRLRPRHPPALPARGVAAVVPARRNRRCFRCDEDGEYCELARYPAAG